MCKNQLDQKECPFAHNIKELSTRFKPKEWVSYFEPWKPPTVDDIKKKRKKRKRAERAIQSAVPGSRSQALLRKPRAHEVDNIDKIINRVRLNC